MTINELINILESENITPSIIRNAMQNLRSVLCIPSLILSKESKILRATVINDIKDVTNISRLSYKPAILNESFQRASCPNNTMFYGISAKTYLEAAIGCLGETCQCLRNTDPTPDYYKVIISQWGLKTDINLVQTINMEGHNKSEIFNNNSDFSHFIYSMAKNDKRDIERFWTFINSNFTKVANCESDYWISAIFTEYLISLGYNGVVYESVEAVDPRLKDVHCIALKPSFVDTNLKFEKAKLYEFSFINTSTSIVPKATMEITLDNDILKYKNI